MKLYGWFKDLHDEVKDTFDYKLASLELDITERIIQKMHERNMSRADLAKELGISKAAVSKLFNNGSNLTLKTLLRISEVLQCDLRLRLCEPIIKIAAVKKGKIVYPLHFPRNQKYCFMNDDKYQSDSEFMVNYG